MPDPTPLPTRLVTMTRLQDRLGGVSKAKIHRLVNDGALPPPIRVGRENAWRESDVAALIERLAGEARVRPLSPANYEARGRKPRQTEGSAA